MSKKTLCLISSIFLLFVFTGTSLADITGWYKFDESSGTVADDASANDNDGDVYATDWAPFDGMFGGAIDLGIDNNDYVSADATYIDNTQGTVMGWIKLEGEQTGTRYAFGHMYDGWANRIQIFCDGSDNQLDIGLGDNHRVVENVETLTADTWYYVALTWDSSGNWYFYLNGEEDASGTYNGLNTINPFFHIGNNGKEPFNEGWQGKIDDVRLYDNALSGAEIQSVYSPLKATNPNPADGATDVPFATNLSWTAASDATMRNVYFGTNPASLPILTEEWVGTSFSLGTLELGTTYYWQVDEIGGGVATTGDVWSFTTIPGRATDPDPADGAEFVPSNANLSWSAGLDAQSHDVYMGTDAGTLVLEGAGLTSTSYDPGGLDSGTAYYWRVDEHNPGGVATGTVWSFLTEGKAHSPSPSDMAGNLALDTTLSWSAGTEYGSHDVYFGTDYDAVNNSLRPEGDIDIDGQTDEVDLAMIADQWLTDPEGGRLSADLNADGNVDMIDFAIVAKSWGETADSIYKGNQRAARTTYDPGLLDGETTYYWRIDEIQSSRRYRGDIWSFSTVVPDLAAFPGAEGWAFDTVGGRGGQVIKVTNLNTSGAGSLAAACATEGPRIVVFEVSGVINGTVYITKPYITIAGQTAPGGGITIEGMVKSYDYAIHDVIIRHIRVRPQPSIGSGGDGFQLGGVGTYNMILDHCSVCWGNDEVIDFYNAHDMTVQWCTIEESDPTGHTKGAHNFGMISTADDSGATSAHHNLWAHHYRRVPCMAPYRLDAAMDFRNNLIYNCDGGLAHDGHVPNSLINVLNNYWVRGPQSSINTYPFATITGNDYHITNNYFEGWGIQGPPQYWSGVPSWVQYNNNGNHIASPGYVPPITTHPVMDVYDIIMAKAGAWPRDRVTLRTLDEVTNQTGGYGRDAPAAPTDAWFMDGLTPTTPPTDTDNDGMSDTWETAHGLNPNNPADATAIVPSGASPSNRHLNYTYIEYYINELADNLVP